ncbi:hypothetical protein GCM10009544_14370 [Streptomyces stramineus]|uniref:DUF4190 domain-containing protein n=1 Tax=Streptomyces stramineus TaxID=173861 RepID=A0ABN0ZMV2_9ACTN
MAAPPVYLWWWLGVTALLTPSGLLARLVNLRAAEGRPGPRADRVLFMGCGGLAACFGVFLTAALVTELVT